MNGKVTAAAEMLATAYRERRAVTLPNDLVPRDLDEATLMQDAAADRIGQRCVGWKLGLTNTHAQTTLGFPHPFTGRLFADMVQRSPARFSMAQFVQPLMETEIAFRMGSGLPPRNSAYEEEEVLAAVETALVGVEIADSRTSGTWPFPIPVLAADNGATGGFVVGPDIPDWRKRALEAIPATLEFDGTQVSGPVAEAARTLPIPVLVWGINALSRRGIGVQAGDIIATGSTCVPRTFNSPVTAVARFEGLGEIHIVVEAATES